MSKSELAFSILVQGQVVQALEQGRTADYVEGLVAGVVISGRMSADEAVEAVRAATARFGGGPRSSP